MTGNACSYSIILVVKSYVGSKQTYMPFIYMQPATGVLYRIIHKPYGVGTRGACEGLLHQYMHTRQYSAEF